ncbi:MULTISPECIES: oligosaccharide flippase family protein [Pseudomonas]|uniref:oligosaccharide flippase family protein n=1 Tax=Pseudomonas TaxID=286 RepID=UPI0035BEEE98
MFKLFIRDSVIYAIPALLSKGLALFLVPLYTRVLSPEDYGSLDLLLVFSGLIALTIALEVSQGIARFYSAETDPERRCDYASSAFWFTAWCYSLFAVITLAYADDLSNWIMGREGLTAAFKVGIVYIFFNGLFNLIQNQFRWELRSKHYALVSIIVTLVTAGAAVLLTYGAGMGLQGLLWGMSAGVIIGTVYGLYHLRQSFRFRFDWARLKEMLAFSIPLVPASVTVLASIYIDRLLINHFVSIGEVGLYGVAVRLASVVSLVMVGFQGALTPLIYTYYREADTPRQLARIFRVFCCFALLTYLALGLFAHDVLVLMTTADYYSASKLIIFLVPSILLAQMYIFTPGISIAKKTHMTIWINLAGLIANIALGLLLIPRLGGSGAAIAMLLGSSLTFAIYMLCSQRLYPVPHKWWPLCGSMTATVVALFLALRLGSELDSYLRWLVNLIFISGTAVIFLALGLVQVSELRKAGQLVRSRLKLFSQRSS